MLRTVSEFKSRRQFQCRIDADGYIRIVYSTGEVGPVFGKLIENEGLLVVAIKENSIEATATSKSWPSMAAPLPP